MEFLKFLEGLRNPVMDSFFSIITHLGEETVFILVGLVFFWCINKKQGYYILSVGFAGTVINQFLKLLFRIPRPWVRDESFTIVESARAEATGYSFPSGHTQSALGVFGSIARIDRRAWVRIACVAACVLVPLSRMWLGVHTPADVGVSTLVALVLVFALYPIVNKAMESKMGMRILFASMLVLSAAFLAFVLLFKFPADADAENIAHGISNAYKIAGCVLGLWLAYELDERFIHFETTAVWWVQIIKLVAGLIPLLAIKSGLKAPLLALCGGNDIANGLRYFLITAFAGCVWPLTFKLFNRLSSKK
ncbi:MAG: phosphatase PAP2 family protein [Clostridia bacterium]|nr:phosphatase PAP2 family protein [Clostridia bacterium]